MQSLILQSMNFSTFYLLVFFYCYEMNQTFFRKVSNQIAMKI